MRLIKSFYFVAVLMQVALPAIAQRKQVSEGNRLYEAKQYKDAATYYQEALKKNPTFTPGMFNLGNALFQQKSYEASRKVLEAAAKSTKQKPVAADAHYNIGNTFMREQKWEEAINAYKESLRRDPGDEAAKYNLSYALAMMKKNQGGGGKNNKQDKDQKQDQQDQNKDQNKNQNKDQNKDQQDNQNQQRQENQQQEQKGDQQQRPQPQPSKLSEEQADQLLNALAQEERKLHDRKEKGKAIRVKVDKDW